MGRCAALLLMLAMPGCVIVQVGATNPIPGLTTVAVAPFLNLSQEPEFVADGRRAALAYFAELQKTPGFQVIPVGVVEQAIRENNLRLSRPEDALELCRILGCDAVVVGAITDYDPYYPPRLGLQVSWYSPTPWAFEPGMPVDPYARKLMRLEDEALDREEERQRRAAKCDAQCSHSHAAREVLRAQSDDASPAKRPVLIAPSGGVSPEPAPMQPVPLAAPAPLPIEPPPGPILDFDPRRPLMSYTRMFDASDAALCAVLRDWLELSGDRRAGSWESALHRTDEFIRFCSHQMIVEMLTLHGGDAQRRIVFKFRQYR